MQPIDLVFTVSEDFLPDIKARRDTMSAAETLKMTAFDRGGTRALDTGRLLATDNVIDGNGDYYD